MHINELIKTDNDNCEENFWFPTPVNPENENEHTPIQQCILLETGKLAGKKQRDPIPDSRCNLRSNPDSRGKFLNMFQSDGSLIQGNENEQPENVLVERNDIA